MFRKSPRKDSSWRVYENPDAATYARPDPPQWARTRGGEGPEAYLRNAEKAKSHPFPPVGPAVTGSAQTGPLTGRGVLRSTYWCRRGLSADSSTTAPGCSSLLRISGTSTWTKRPAAKAQTPKKASTEKYASATGRFPSSQTSIPNEGRKFYPGSFYSAS